jgi:hypothetical protein
MPYLLALLLVFPSAGARAAVALRPAPTTVLTADLLGNGHTEQIVLDPRQAHTLSIRFHGRTAGQEIPKRWKPWKIAIADVDGDGKPEIAVAIVKSTRFFPQPHNCLYLYNWNGRALVPKWRGSSLGEPFTDFGFYRASHSRSALLIALERTPAGRARLVAYEWNGFGFSEDWRRGDWPRAHLLRITSHTITLSINAKPTRIPIPLQLP